MINDVHFPGCTTEPITYLSLSPPYQAQYVTCMSEVGKGFDERNCSRIDSVAGSERRLESAVVIACSRLLP